MPPPDETADVVVGAGPGGSATEASRRDGRPADIARCTGPRHGDDYLEAWLADRPQVVRRAVTYGLPNEPLTRCARKALVHLSEPHGGTAGDRVPSTLSRVVPAA